MSDGSASTALTHMSAVALDMLRGAHTGEARPHVAACDGRWLTGERFDAESGRIVADVEQRHIRDGAPTLAPTCPACAVLMDAALEGRLPGSDT